MLILLMEILALQSQFKFSSFFSSDLIYVKLLYIYLFYVFMTVCIEFLIEC